jgi:salicylate hydroxylase
VSDISVYEQAAEPVVAGHGILLSPNATRVLYALGLKTALNNIGFQSDALHYRSHRSGYQIAMRPLGPFAEARYGAPFCQVLRSDLIRLLTERLRELEIDVRYDWRCSSLTQIEGAVSLASGSGETRRHDLVAGSDGVHSHVRSFMHTEAPPTFTGHVAWRGITPAADLPAQFNSVPATIWLGPGRHIVHYPVRDGDLLAFTAVVENSEQAEESWFQRGERKALAEQFKDWHPVIQALVNASEDLHHWPLYDRTPLARWTESHVTLLGDACHPVLPYLSQGAALAIEDAWVLSRMLETWEEDTASALSEYERYRRPRAARVQAGSRREGENLHLRDPWQIRWRNLRMALGSRYLPEIAMERYDWLYGYDCVKGFG